ncbi:hypothetical protein [Aldersonia kunmingensis]|uniref:hypothetical protein n=1 Tax=Aldersonia kunmingensis TaxID=408066 RepID=UPI0008328C90|nr:hypothetical protein [Aldersonia kunmingensis]
MSAPTRKRALRAAAALDPAGRIPPAARPVTVLAYGRIDRYGQGASGHIAPGGDLRILNAAKLITAGYPAGSWTILPAE